MALEIKPPQKLSNKIMDKVSIFLGGSIDMGESENWQLKVKEFFKNNDDVVLLNPRRDNWDSSWLQEFENANFYQQVNWELNAMEKANLIIFNFVKGSKSPITLLELGLFADSKKIVVCCPKGFWRKGNIDIVCDKYGIKLFENLEDLLSNLDSIN